MRRAQGACAFAPGAKGNRVARGFPGRVENDKLPHISETRRAMRAAPARPPGIVAISANTAIVDTAKVDCRRADGKTWRNRRERPASSR
jgi:hypothetical protein